VRISGEEGFGTQVVCSDCFLDGGNENEEPTLAEEVALVIDDDDEVLQAVKMSRKRKAYTAGFKLEAVKFARHNSAHKASEKYGVGRSSIIDWMKQESKLLSLKY
jgi:hypothetical protein